MRSNGKVRWMNWRFVRVGCRSNRWRRSSGRRQGCTIPCMTSPTQCHQLDPVSSALSPVYNQSINIIPWRILITASRTCPKNQRHAIKSTELQHEITVVILKCYFNITEKICFKNRIYCPRFSLQFSQLLNRDGSFFETKRRLWSVQELNGAFLLYYL